MDSKPDDAAVPTSTAAAPPSKPRAKRWWLAPLKVVVAVGILGALVLKVSSREGMDAFTERLSHLSPAWVALAFAAQLAAVACSIFRWQILLRGQGLHASLRHLTGAFMTGRFFGIAAPGGWTGQDAFRIYDIASRTSKTARATATVGVDKIIGQAAFGSTLVFGSFFGWRALGLTGVLIVDGAFLALIALVVTVLIRPHVVRAVASRLPTKLRLRLSTMVDAVCAYQGKTGVILPSVALSIGTHAFTNLIYVCSARALGAEVSAGDVFFVSGMQILATFAPLTPNGIGIREAVAGALYANIGIDASLALLIPIVGFLVDAVVSVTGGFFLLTRGAGYAPVIRVDDPEREDAVNAQLPEVPESARPKVLAGLSLGLGAGLFAGIALGLGEAAVTLQQAGGRAELDVLTYGAFVYGLFLMLAGAAGGAALAYVGKLIRRAAVAPHAAYARWVALLFTAPAFAIGAFRVRRDLYDEELVWKSAAGIVVLAKCAVVALAVFAVLALFLHFLTKSRVGAWLLRPWGTPALGAAVLAATVAYTRAFAAPPAGALDLTARAPAPPSGGPVIVLVVDTLRADALPLWGYSRGRTPNLDRFAQDSIRFENAFANASWTRPSFATILTGRHPSSHRVMGKSSSLPDQVVTLPEALSANGYVTGGIVTNYNVAPFFNFQQGFDEYRYLEPDFVLGANDTAAKLLFIQAARQTLEKLDERLYGTQPGRAYRDAETVNREVFGWLDSNVADDGLAQGRPWMLFVGYMDPHDPYFPHPYGASGYSRAAHQTPRPEEAAHLRELYDGEITFWDEHFGRLVAELQRRGLYDQATIVVTADHGEEFCEHGGFWHGTSLYDEQIRVPLLVKLPSNTNHGRVERRWVQHVDLMPTILRQVGLEIPEGVQGGSLFTGHNQVFAEESHEGNVLSALRTRRGQSELKVIHANADNPRGLPETELFRVDMDPNERVNLAGELPFESDYADAQLTAVREQAGVGAVEERSVDVRAGADTARLRALGYAGGESEPRPDARPTPN